MDIAAMLIPVIVPILALGCIVFGLIQLSRGKIIGGSVLTLFGFATLAFAWLYVPMLL